MLENLSLLLGSLLIGLGVAFAAQKYLKIIDGKILAALVVAIPLLALLASGKLSKLNIFGIEATFDKVKEQSIAASPLANQKLSSLKDAVQGGGRESTIKVADGFFGLQKQIIVLDTETDWVAELQPPPGFELTLTDTCVRPGTDAATQNRNQQILQAAHTFASTLQPSLQQKNFDGVALVTKGVLKAYFAPQRFYDLLAIRLWDQQRGINPPRLPCQLAYPLNQSLIWDLLSDMQNATRYSDPFESVSQDTTIGQVFAQLAPERNRTLAIADGSGRFKGIIDRNQLAVSTLAGLLGTTPPK